jgi:hypothetical protein
MVMLKDYASGVEGEHVAAAVVATALAHRVGHLLGPAAVTGGAGRRGEGEVGAPLPLAFLGGLALGDCHGIVRLSIVWRSAVPDH